MDDVFLNICYLKLNVIAYVNMMFVLWKINAFHILFNSKLIYITFQLHIEADNLLYITLPQEACTYEIKI